MTEALQRQLANDEPKCGNCAYWQDPEGALGLCTYNIRKALKWGGEHVFTADLAVCSKWEGKSYGTETKAETQQA